ncbi:MAG TPA: class I SAM-dependent methyltransferase [Desulfobacterales bacterium]|nr:class I SAM-dependent methyltransferase [Desulfobacterales bacterium]
MIDWNRMWQEARRRKTWQRKTSEDWNKRAAGFARRHKNSVYVKEFLNRLPLSAGMSVLDMGCGPGTLTIPLAPKVREITAVDFSPGMLEILTAKAAEGNLNNITTRQGAWEDDWQALGLGRYDLIIASRSLAVDDLKGALDKLRRAARGWVFIGDRVGSGPFDPAMFAAIGRPFHPGPDYIYTINILYQMGIHARLDFIDLPPAHSYKTREEAISSWAWMFHDLTATENDKLNRHLSERLTKNNHGHWCLRDEVCPSWALISWRQTTHQHD